MIRIYDINRKLKFPKTTGSGAVLETDPVFNAWLLGPPNVSIFTNDAGYITSFSETDPIYTASTWFSTTNNSSNWNTAFGWGNHALVGYATATSSTAFTNKTGNISQWTNDSGYLTSTGVTPAALTRTNDTNVTLTLGGTPATALLQATSLTLGWTGTLADARITSSTNWNTAFGWGNHASAGYLTTSVAAATYQPLDSDLTTIAGLTATTDNFIVSVSSAWASRTPSQVKTTLGLVIGTNVQAWDADLDAIAALAGTSGFLTKTAANTWALDTSTYLTTASAASTYQPITTFSTGLTGTTTVTANLSTGVAGGQSVIGGTATGNSLTLSSTSFATKGSILFGASSYNESVNTLGIGTTASTTNKVTFTDTVLAGSGSLAGSLLNMTQTWNTSGAPTAIKLLVTDTAASASALLIDLQTSSAGSLFKMTKAGAVTIANSLIVTGAAQCYNYISQNPFAFSVLYVFGNNATFQPASGTRAVFQNIGTFSPTSGTAIESTFESARTVNQTGGANGITRGIWIHDTLTAASDYRAVDIGNNSGKGINQTGASATNAFAGATTFTNDITLTDKNLILSATTGTKIGTATTQKLSFYNATPIVQPTTAVATSAFVANTSGIVDDSATFGGYKISQIVKALQTLGLLA